MIRDRFPDDVSNSPTPYTRVQVQRGDDRSIVFPVRSIDGDVTGWPVEARAWSNEYPSAKLLRSWSSRTGTAIAEGDTVTLLLDDSRTWEFDRAYFEVALTHPDGPRTIEARGVLIVQGRAW